jgi:hypothetical protein
MMYSFKVGSTGLQRPHAEHRPAVSLLMFARLSVLHSAVAPVVFVPVGLVSILPGCFQASRLACAAGNL